MLVQRTADETDELRRKRLAQLSGRPDLTIGDRTLAASPVSALLGFR
jgi:hypothetical protein